MGHLWAAVTVGGGLGVGVDLDSLELRGNPRSWRHTDKGHRTIVNPSEQGAAVGVWEMQQWACHEVKAQ